MKVDEGVLVKPRLAHGIGQHLRLNATGLMGVPNLNSRSKSVSATETVVARRVGYHQAYINTVYIKIIRKYQLEVILYLKIIYSFSI